MVGIRVACWQWANEKGDILLNVYHFSRWLQHWNGLIVVGPELLICDTNPLKDRQPDILPIFPKKNPNEIEIFFVHGRIP